MEVAPSLQHFPRGAGVGFGVGVAVGVGRSALAPSAAPPPPPSWPPSLSSTASPSSKNATETATTPAAAGAAGAPTAAEAAAAAAPTTRASPVALSLTTVGTLPCHFLFAPPSPAGRSSSASPTSSFKSSPLAGVRPPLLPPALPLSGGRDLPPSERGYFPLAWSLSDSTLSCGSRSTGGIGGGMSSVSASACSDAASPLVGMRFVAGEGVGGPGAAAGAGAGAGASKERSRPNSWSARGRGHPLVGVRGSVPLPLALCGVGRAVQGEVVPACRAPVTLPVAGGGGGPAAAVGEEAAFEGGVGGRQGKRPRRYFFP